MRIYFDVCCLSRYFDDQEQIRIRMETQTITKILEKCRDQSIELIVSEAVEYEIGKTVDPNKKQFLTALAAISCEKIMINDSIVQRARELEKLKFDGIDSLHVSCAEHGKIEIFFTTDDKLQKKYEKGIGNIKVRVCNPLFWFMEKELEDENNERNT